MATYTVVSNSCWAYMDSILTTKSSYIAKGAEISASTVFTNVNGIQCIVASNLVSGTTSGSSISGRYIPIEYNGETWLRSTSDSSVTSTNDTTSTTTSDDEDDDYSEDLNYFTISYGYNTYESEDQYLAQLEEGLDIEDLRGVMGIPHQFISTTDPRIDGTTNNVALGRAYSSFIIKRIPLLLMTPGIANFMSTASESQRNLTYGTLLGKISESEFNILMDGYSGKYYSLRYSYTEYFYYVNAMLRSAAYFLEIQNKEIDKKKLGTLNWMYYCNDGSDIFGHKGLKRFLGPYAGCVAFYVNPGETVDDSFSNSTTTSQLASSMDTLTDTGRELNFLIGSVGSLTGVGLTDETGLNSLSSTIENLRSSTNGSNNRLLGKVLGKAGTILAGGRLIFPEIWSDSSFGRSYACSMKLVAGSGSKLSVYLDILVPMYHLLAFTLPRQSDGESYYSPFLVRAYCQGAFNVDMGIITSLNITRGAEGEWTIDGLPTTMSVSFDIKDLYDGFFMSKQTTEKGFFSGKSTGIMANITELDYIANTCGVNVNDQEIIRTIKMYWTLGFATGLTDKVTIGIFGSIAQFFNQKMNNIFGVF